MKHKIFLKFLQTLPAEFSHSLFVKILRFFPFSAPKLKFENTPCKFFDKDVKNIYGVAAGLDKNAEIIPALFKMGFGFVEVGTVTPRPQYGNSKPRVFRLKEEKSILNFMGFPSKGAKFVLDNIKRYKRKNGEILGVNIGRNKDGEDTDYAYLITMFHKYCDYITINISSPNTPNLRQSLSNTDKFKTLMQLIKQCIDLEDVKIPILLKLTPDGDNLEKIYKIACKYGISGFVLTNTTTDKSSAPEKFQNLQIGGISGQLVREKSIHTLQEFVKINTENKFIFSCGGIDSSLEAQSRITIGANAVQIYTSLIYNAF